MTKRIEQSRKHGHHDPRWTSRMHVVADGPLPFDPLEEPTGTPPTLVLVGGTEVAATSPEPIATVGT